MLAHTFATLKAAAAHALGGNPDSRISKGLIVNRALNHLVNAHPWPWAVATTTLDYVADQNYIDLPADFAELVNLSGGTQRYTTIRQLDAEQFAGLAQFGISDTGFLGYVLTSAPQTVATAAPRWRLLIAPKPAANQANAISILYRKQLATFPASDADTTADANYPAIPAGQHDTLYQLVRAFATSMEETTSPQAQAEWALANQSIQRDITAANRARSPSMGVMRGGVVDEYLGGHGGGASAQVGNFRIPTSDFTG